MDRTLGAMPAAISPVLLSLLLPRVPNGYPAEAAALRVLTDLTGTARADILDGLLAGPLRQGPLPARVLQALAGDDCASDREQRLRDALSR